jgi:hypothetical protein
MAPKVLISDALSPAAVAIFKDRGIEVDFQPNLGKDKDKLAELSFKTNEDGTVKVPAVPQGKILIQVIAKGWHTFGKWYDIDKAQDTIAIKLEAPPHWY